jgi:biopolymer transport protein ExbB/TolQ
MGFSWFRQFSLLSAMAWFRFLRSPRVVGVFWLTLWIASFCLTGAALAQSAADDAPKADPFWDLLSNSVYGLLAIDALWGAYCTAMIFLRMRQFRFRNEKQQDQFMAAVMDPLSKGNLPAVEELCEGDRRALPQLIRIALRNRHLEMTKIQELVIERFQRDILGDLESRINWVNNVIKTAPMLGLLGTVLGMMAAFGKLYALENVKPQMLAGDISFALITTAIGLAIAIPATALIAHVNINIRRLEDYVSTGLSQFFDLFEVVNRRAHSPLPRVG